MVAIIAIPVKKTVGAMSSIIILNSPTIKEIANTTRILPPPLLSIQKPPPSGQGLSYPLFPANLDTHN